MFHFISLSWNKLRAMFCYFLGKNYVCTCGHKAKRKTVLTINGNSGVYTINPKKPDYCPKCFAEAVIQCTWCGKTILPGDAITLGHPKPGFVVPKYAVEYKPDSDEKSGRALIGCLRWDCADSGMDRAGFWVMPGKVQRAVSPMEIMLYGNPKGETLIFNDVSDIKEAILLPEEPLKNSELN